MSKEKKVNRSCNQCAGQMWALFAEHVDPHYMLGDLHIVSVCSNPACPNYALLQIPLEQMPKEKK